MRYYVKESSDAGLLGRTAWTKARGDAERICADEGFAELAVCPDAGDRVNAGLTAKLRAHFAAGGVWERALSGLGAGDTLFLQLPVMNNCFYLARILQKLRRKGVHIVALVHDLELLRMSVDKNIGLRSRLRMRVEETSVLEQCGRIIVHNEKMLDFMAARGVRREKLTPLGIFDYLMDEGTERAVAGRAPSPDRERLIVAGNLSPAKAGYVYALPEKAPVNLYGVFYEPQGEAEALRYMGAFEPDELPAKLDGGFGLVWDGPSAETCRGTYGEYLRYNNPHKTSLYLASGLPVVIWEQAALAELVEREQAGVAVGSIAEAAERIAAMPREEYDIYFQNAARVGERLRRGCFLKDALRNGGVFDDEAV